VESVIQSMLDQTHNVPELSMPRAVDLAWFLEASKLLFSLRFCVSCFIFVKLYSAIPDPSSNLMANPESFVTFSHNSGLCYGCQFSGKSVHIVD
jgi:hypothetical protein